MTVPHTYLEDKCEPRYFPSEFAYAQWNDTLEMFKDGDVNASRFLPRRRVGLLESNLTLYDGPLEHICVTKKLRGCVGEGTCSFRRVPTNCCFHLLRDGICHCHGQKACPEQHFVCSFEDGQVIWWGMTQRTCDYFADVQICSGHQIQRRHSQRGRRMSRAENNRREQRVRVEAVETVLGQAARGNREAVSALIGEFRSQRHARARSRSWSRSPRRH